MRENPMPHAPFACAAFAPDCACACPLCAADRCHEAQCPAPETS